MKWDKKKLEAIIAISIITVFSGQIYINPFSQWFRFSFAVVSLPLLLLYFRNISVMTVCTIIAFLMALFRSFVYYFANDAVMFSNIIIQFIPVASFYIIYGYLFKFFNIRNKLNSPVNFILLLWVCDSLGNTGEAVIRSFMYDFLFEKAIFVIIVIGGIRAVFIYLTYYVVHYYKQRYEREQSENKYRELLFFVSKLKTELFFLRKSLHDIENTMEKSYLLYEKIENYELKDDALNIATNIHEIKKDYQRVVLGMENTLQEINREKKYKISDLFNIIENNTIKFVNESNKDIKLNFNVINDFYTKEIYPLISVLNNLIINSIEAIAAEGEIIVEAQVYKENVVFSVIDNGRGIDIEDSQLIFDSGFSTKIDYNTGKVSSGLGLFHVKHIIENYFSGDIRYCSQYKDITKFLITIPYDKIILFTD